MTRKLKWFAALEGDDGAGSGGDNGSLVTTVVTDLGQGGVEGAVSAVGDDAGGTGDDAETEAGDTPGVADAEDPDLGDNGAAAGDDDDDLQDFLTNAGADDEDERRRLALEYARSQGWREPEAEPTSNQPSRGPSAEDQARQLLSRNPRQLAHQLAEQNGQGSDWADNYTHVIAAQQQNLRTIFGDRATTVGKIDKRFGAGVGARYVDAIINMTVNFDSDASLNPKTRRAALAMAIGEQMLSGKGGGQKAASSTGGQTRAQQTLSTPTTGAKNGGSVVSLGRLDAGDQRFIKSWQDQHNAGKPPTAKQLAAMKAEGLIG